MVDYTCIGRLVSSQLSAAGAIAAAARCNLSRKRRLGLRLDRRPSRHHGRGRGSLRRHARTPRWRSRASASPGSARRSRRAPRRRRRPFAVLRCHGSVDTPGLIDCHTHLVYGGNRAGEFEQRLLGASYEQIARAGGGIQSTVDATRARQHRGDAGRRGGTRPRLSAEGVTTIEIKSGLRTGTGCRGAACCGSARHRRRVPVSVRTTFLGLHALPREFARIAPGLRR